MAEEGHLDFCCLKETRWRGEGDRKLGPYKSFRMDCEKGIHGVGMLVPVRWIEKVLDVKRVSERLMVVKVIVVDLCSTHYLFMLRRRDGQWWKKRRVPGHVGGSIVGDRFW